MEQDLGGICLWSDEVSKKAVKKLLTVLVIVMLGMISLLCTTALMIPGTPEEAMDEALTHAPKGGVLGWRSSISKGGVFAYGILELGITYEEYEASMRNDLLRIPSAFAFTPLALVDPDDPYVLKVVSLVEGLTEGEDDSVRIAVACHIIQTAVRYMDDSELYGWSDLWATPMETLYLGRGDCEDCTVLLMSVLTAMGHECALLDYPSHVDATVRVDGEWLCCHASADSPCAPSGDLDYDGTPIIRTNAPSDINRAIADDAVAGSAYRIRRLIS